MPAPYSEHVIEETAWLATSDADGQRRDACVSCSV